MRATRALLRLVDAHRKNPTGFDIEALKKSTGKPRYDPWERREAWRYEGAFSRWNRYRRSLPGLGTGIVAFTAYCIYEKYFMADDHHHHGDEHGKEHH